MLDAVFTRGLDAEAAVELPRKRLKPEAIVTDKLKPSGAAMPEICIDASRHETSGRWIGDRAENSPFL